MLVSCGYNQYVVTKPLLYNHSQSLVHSTAALELIAAARMSRKCFEFTDDIPYRYCILQSDDNSYFGDSGRHLSNTSFIPVLHAGYQRFQVFVLAGEG